MFAGALHLFASIIVFICDNEVYVSFPTAQVAYSLQQAKLSTNLSFGSCERTRQMVREAYHILLNRVPRGA